MKKIKMNDLERLARGYYGEFDPAHWDVLRDCFIECGRFEIPSGGWEMLAGCPGTPTCPTRRHAACRNLMYAALGERWAAFWKTFDHSGGFSVSVQWAVFDGTRKWGVCVGFGTRILFTRRIDGDAGPGTPWRVTLNQAGMEPPENVTELFGTPRRVLTTPNPPPTEG